MAAATAEIDAELLALMEESERRQSRRQFFRLYPDHDILAPDGSVAIHARHKYPKHLEFFAAGSDYEERCFLAANRVGKSYGGGGFEITCHLTGLYPHWWKGRRFKKPVRAWAAGKTNETTRDIIQQDVLLGRVSYNGNRRTVSGTGLIPGDCLGEITWKQGVANFVDTVAVKHVSGGWSWLGFKSYDQNRGSFEGTAKEVIWLDEEPPLDIYTECLTRTATTSGIIMLTFTPLEGLSQVVMQFLPQDMRPG